MFDGIIKNTISDVLKGLLVAWAAQLGLTGNTSQQFVAGGLAIFAGLWMWYENRGHQMIVDALKIKSPPPAGKSIASHAQAIVGALALLFIVCGSVFAADLPVPVKAPAVAVRPSLTNCTPSLCNGFYIGGVLGTNTQNASILPTLSTVSGGNGLFGGDIGYRFWNGNVYFGAEFDALAQTGQSGTAVNFNPQNVMFIAEGKVGMSLAGLFNTGTAGASQGPLQNVLNALQTSLISPYIVPVADCINNVGGGVWIQRYCGGVGAEFAVHGPFTISAEYLNLPAAGGLDAANLFLLKGNVNF